MKTTYTYTFTVSKPTYCPFSGLHHTDGHRLVLRDNSLSFFAPGADGGADRQLTDPQPLKSDSDVRYVSDWLAAGVKAGTLVEVGAKAAGAPKIEPPRAAAQQTPQTQKAVQAKHVVSQPPLPPPR